MAFKLSVIIPSYNEEKYIEKTLKALKEQDYKNMEIIVVDSSTSEETRIISKKYADRTILLDERGVSKARNLGAQNASGDILIFIDADTIMEKGTLTEITRKFEIDKNVVCVCAYVDVESSIGSRLLFKSVSEMVWLLAKIGLPLFYGSCVAYRRTAFEKICFSERLITCEDIDLSRRARRLGKCVLDRKARVLTSARRVEKGGIIKTVFFHIQNLANYLVSGKAEENYPAFR